MADVLLSPVRPSLAPALLRVVALLVVALLGGACDGRESASPGGRDGTPPVDAAALVAIVNATTPRSGLAASRICAGALVASDVVLTAAHCVDGRQRGARSLRVVVGDAELCDGVREGGSRVVARIRLHPTYDLAALTLARDLEGVRPFHLAAQPIEPGDRVVAVGWGRSGTSGADPCRATAAALRRVVRPRCDHRGTAVCLVAHGDRLLCAGDSGDPVVEATRGDVLVAVASATEGCGRGDVSWHVGVHALREWISGSRRSP